MGKVIIILKNKISVIIAGIISIVTCIILALLEFKTYGSAIDTGVMYLMVIAFELFIFSFFKKGEVENEKSLYEKICNVLFIIIIIIDLILSIFIMLYKNNYILMIYQSIIVIVILLILLLLEHYKKITSIKHNLSNVISIIYSLILITTISYFLIVAPCTVKNARVVLENNGYENIEFSTSITNIEIYKKLMPGANEIKLKNDEEKLGFYLFVASKGNERYDVFVSLVSGEIVWFYKVNY